jgi:hypothetical protein
MLPSRKTGIGLTLCLLAALAAGKSSERARAALAAPRSAAAAFAAPHAAAVLAAAAAPRQDAQPRMVVFEFFSALDCTVCKTAGPAGDALQAEYLKAGKPVLFLEQQLQGQYPDVDQRSAYWFSAYGRGGSVQPPLNMVDSGWRISNGQEQDFTKKYRGQVDDALRRKAGAEIGAVWERDRSGGLNARATVKNLTDFVLGPSNLAKVHVLVYEESKLVETGRFVRAGASAYLSGNLNPGETATVNVTVPADQFRGVNMGRAKVVALFDYRNGGASGPFELLNAVMAVQGTLNAPTAVPTPGAPTDTPEPPPATDTPEATPTPGLPRETPLPTANPPTATSRPIVLPTRAPTQTAPAPTPPAPTQPATATPPGARGIYLPLLKRGA